MNGSCYSYGKSGSFGKNGKIDMSCSSVLVELAWQIAIC